MNTLETLDRLTHAWGQADREVVGRWFGIHWTALRYQGTGSMEGLEFLYPFLNDSDKDIRRFALRAAAQIFRRRGADGIEKLGYITANRDLSIRDRSSTVVGMALASEPATVILDCLRPSFTHRGNFIRAHGTAALGYAADGRAQGELLPVFEERLADRDGFVRSAAVDGLAEAFAGSGHPRALALLEPFTPFPVIETAPDEPHHVWHFRWRNLARMHSDSASAVARIGRSPHAEPRAVELLRRYLHPENVPPKMGFEGLLSQRQGVWAMCWLLLGKPAEAVREMEFVLRLPAMGEPVWSRRLARSAAIFTLPGTFAGSGREGIDIATHLMASREHATLRTGILSLGVAARGTCNGEILARLEPLLSHPSGAVRDAANLAVGLAFHGSGRPDVAELLRRANLDDRRGPGTNYPLGVGLLFQGTGDEPAAHALTQLFAMNRTRLTRYAGLGVSLIYQGTSSPRAVELLLPMLESSEVIHACLALLLVDFDRDQLAALARGHCLADGPGAAHGFTLKHFLDTPPPRFDPWMTWL